MDEGCTGKLVISVKSHRCARVWRPRAAAAAAAAVIRLPSEAALHYTFSIN